MERVLYVNVLSYEPWWSRWFFQRRWLQNHLSGRHIRRFKRSNDRINVTIQCSTVFLDELKVPIEKHLTALAHELDYDRVEGDIIERHDSRVSFPPYGTTKSA